MIRLIIIGISPWTTSKFSGERTRRVTFKKIDDPENTKQYYYLNLDHKFKEVYQWLPAIKLGNILDVELQSNNKNVNLFGGFYLIKESQ